MSFAQIMLLHFDELFESESNNLTSFLKYLPQITFMKILKITSNKPSKILVVIKNPVPICVKNGVSNVNTDVAAIPITNTRLPPNLVAK